MTKTKEGKEWRKRKEKKKRNQNIWEVKTGWKKKKTLKTNDERRKNNVVATCKGWDPAHVGMWVKFKADLHTVPIEMTQNLHIRVKSCSLSLLNNIFFKGVLTKICLILITGKFNIIGLN